MTILWSPFAKYLYLDEFLQSLHQRRIHHKHTPCQCTCVKDCSQKVVRVSNMCELENVVLFVISVNKVNAIFLTYSSYCHKQSHCLVPTFASKMVWSHASYVISKHLILKFLDGFYLDGEVCQNVFSLNKIVNDFPKLASWQSCFHYYPRFSTFLELCLAEWALTMLSFELRCTWKHFHAFSTWHYASMHHIVHSWHVDILLQSRQHDHDVTQCLGMLLYLSNCMGWWSLCLTIKNPWYWPCSAIWWVLGCLCCSLSLLHLLLPPHLVALVQILIELGQNQKPMQLVVLQWWWPVVPQWQWSVDLFQK